MAYKDDLTAWKAFSLTAHTGKAALTAQLMGLHPSKVSRLLSGLEAELGFSLFETTKRPLIPTSRAAHLLTRLEPVLQEFGAMQRPDFGVRRKTRIRVAGSIEMSRDYYAEDLINYADANPDVEFELMPEATEEDVRAGRCDVALLNHLPPDRSGLTVRGLAATTTFPLASPEYLRRFGTPHTVEDLRHHWGLLHKSKNFPVTHHLMNGNLTSSSIAWKHVFYSHDQLMLKKLVLSHHGITIDLYGAHVFDELARGELVPVLPGWIRPFWEMSIVSRHEAEIENRAIKRFADWWAALESKNEHERMERAFSLRRKALDRMADDAVPNTRHPLPIDWLTD